MNILFIYPIIKPQEPPIHCPYETLELAAIAEQLGHKIKIIDNNAYRLPIDAFRQEVKPEKNWDLIVVQADKVQGKQLSEVSRVVKEVNPSTSLVCFGELISQIPHSIMKWIPQIDAGIIGDPYLTFKSILSGDYGEGFWHKHRGLIYWEGKKLKLTKPQGIIGADSVKAVFDADAILDAVIPFPAYDKSPIETYFKYSSLLYSTESSGYIPLNLGENLRRLDVKTSYQPYNRRHSPSYVVNLIMHLRVHYGVNFISFTDENFTEDHIKTNDDKNWFNEFLDKLEENDLAGLIKWGINSDAMVNEKMLNRAHDLGLSYIFFNADNKKLNAQMTGALKATKNANINPILSFQIGYPNETFASAAATCQFIIDNQVHWDPTFYIPPLNEYREEIVDQHLTAKEKQLLKEQTFEAYVAVLDEQKTNQLFKPDTSKTNLAKNMPIIEEKLRDIALQRWVYSLDDNKLTLNLTPVTDVELAGLKYLLFTHDIDKIKENT